MLRQHSLHGGISYEVERRKWPSSTSGRHVHGVTESMHLDGMDASRVTSNRYLASCRTSVSDDRRREILRTIVSGLRTMREMAHSVHSHEALRGIVSIRA